MRLLHFRSVACSATLIFALLFACGDPFGLGVARIDNTLATVSLHALSGTPVTSPSAYTLQFMQVVRTDQTVAFDFAFDIDAEGHALILPTGALRLGEGSGVQISAQPFDEIKFAPDGGYAVDTSVVVEPGTVVLIRSRPTTCSNQLTSAFFAKLRVLEIGVDPPPNDRQMKFEILVDRNCGFRGLEPGLPTR